MDLFSYLLGKQAGGGGGITPTGTINITENGTVDVTNYASADVNVSGGGLPTAEFNDVNFYDYDGTIRYSYSKNEFLALESLPENPTHNGLIADGWNWTLEGAKEYVRNNDILDIGQNYSTDDGSTRLYVELYEFLTPSTNVVTTGDANATTTIDWGDGTTVESYTGNISGAKQHTYASAGKYVIKIKYTGTGDITFNGDSYGSGAFYDGVNNENISAKYHMCISKIELGYNWKLKNYFFSRLNIKELTIPKTIKFDITYAEGIFNYARCLKAVIIPSVSNYSKKLRFEYCNNISCISFGENFSMEYAISEETGLFNIRRITLSKVTTATTAYRNMKAIPEVIIPNNVTKINTYCFNQCNALQKITMSSITTIEGNIGYNLYALKVIDFSRQTTIPTLGGSTLATNFPSDMKIIVPDALYDDWVAANNWSTYASYIVKASQV